MSLTLDDLKAKLPQIQVQGGVKKRKIAGKDGKEDFEVRTQDGYLRVIDENGVELTSKVVVDVPRDSEPYLPGRYAIGGPNAFSAGDFGALSLNRRGIQLIPLFDVVDGAEEGKSAGGLFGGRK